MWSGYQHIFTALQLRFSCTARVEATILDFPKQWLQNCLFLKTVLLSGAGRGSENKGGCTYLQDTLTNAVWWGCSWVPMRHSGKILQLCFRKCDSSEHLVCFYLVDMLNLINGCISFFILAMRKLKRNSVIIWSTFFSVHTTL